MPIYSALELRKRTASSGPLWLLSARPGGRLETTNVGADIAISPRIRSAADSGRTRRQIAFVGTAANGAKQKFGPRSCASGMRPKRSFQ